MPDGGCTKGFCGIMIVNEASGCEQFDYIIIRATVHVTAPASAVIRPRNGHALLGLADKIVDKWLSEGKRKN